MTAVNTHHRIAIIGAGFGGLDGQHVPGAQCDIPSVFQRTATRIMPHPDRPLDRRVRRLFARAPATPAGVGAAVTR